MATIVIGDVHGCVDELDALLRLLAPGPGDDVILVGDLIAKGPDSRGVLACARERGLRAVMGNHEAHVLRARERLRTGFEADAVKPGARSMVASFDDRDFAQITALPFWLKLPEHNAFVVHAGLVPGIALEAQDLNLLMNIRTLRPDGTGSKRADDGPEWATQWQGPELVLFGHHAVRGLQQYPLAIGLDTGCVYGKTLTACVLPERRLVSVPARRAYAPMGNDA